MSKRSSDRLFKLVKSLTKAEKRNFKIYATRQQSGEDILFVQLFDQLDRMTSYDEEVVLDRLDGVEKRQLANLKRHLYTQLLKSLRLIYSSKHIEIEIREQLDHARILYEKGLYLQALKLLERTRSKADTGQLHILHLEIVEFIKFIEERHITRSRSVEGKVEKLLEESDLLERDISNIVKLSSLKIRISGLYITMGHARDEEDHKMVTEYWKELIRDIDQQDLTLIEQIYLHQSYMWYHYVLLEQDKSLHHAKEWVRLFDENPHLKQDDPVLYMRGLSYVLTTLFRLKGYREHEHWLAAFEEFSRSYEGPFSKTQVIIHDLYLYTARINKYILEGLFTEGRELIPEIEQKLQEYGDRIDIHRIMVFRYKIAYLLFGAGDFDGAIDYLNEIIQLKAGHLRTDIQCYSRLLHLMCHYELNHGDLLPYLVDSVSRFFSKMDDLNEIQKTILDFFRQRAGQNNVPGSSWYKFKSELERLSEKPYEKRAFQHLDIETWVESKITGRSLQQTIRAQYFLAGAQQFKSERV